jgi:hypothetical protein
MLYIGQVTVVNENLFSTGLPGLKERHPVKIKVNNKNSLCPENCLFN